MNIFVSIFILIILFILYKYTYFFHKKRYKILQYGLIISLATLALIDFTIGNKILKDTGFSMIVTLHMGLSLLLFFASLKVMK